MDFKCVVIGEINLSKFSNILFKFFPFSVLVVHLFQVESAVYDEKILTDLLDAISTCKNNTSARYISLRTGFTVFYYVKFAKRKV